MTVNDARKLTAWIFETSRLYDEFIVGDEDYVDFFTGRFTSLMDLELDDNGASYRLGRKVQEFIGAAVLFGDTDIVDQMPVFDDLWEVLTK